MLNRLTLTLITWVNFFPLSHRNDLWAKFGTHMDHPHQVSGVLGECQITPSIITKMIISGLYYTCLSLTANRWVNFISCPKGARFGTPMNRPYQV